MRGISIERSSGIRRMKGLIVRLFTISAIIFSSRRRHTRCLSDWSSDCALPICRFFINRHSEKETDQARAAYQRAVELDPKFALAWAGLAQTHVWDCNYATYATEGGQKGFNAHLEIGRASCRERDEI